MPQSITRTLNHLVGGTRGSEVAEAALVLPLMFMILLGIFWFGQAFRIYGTLTHAAREGARAGVAPACSTCASLGGAQRAQNAYNAVKKALLAAKLDPGQLQMPATTPSLCSCGSSSSSCGSSVTCDPAVSTVCVQANVQLSYSSLNGAGTCGTSVSFRYKYPYHFYLPCTPQPCTSLDLRNLTLPAQAEMRMETQ